MDNKMQVAVVASGITAKTGAVTAIASSASNIFGLNMDQWSVIGIMGGIIIGLLGVLVNGTIRWLEHRDKARSRSADLKLKKINNKQEIQ